MPLKYQNTRRGDTIVEVMFAFAIFSLVAIITVTMMNLGVAASERSLELTVVRNEMNAQAEALRFVHSSYVAELTLPEECDNDNRTKCQQYAALWNTITVNAMSPKGSADAANSYSIEMPVMNCNDLYKDNPNLLVKNHAFVLNTRQLLSQHNGVGYTNDDAYIAVNPELFTMPPLNARIVYASTTGGDGADGGANSTGTLGNKPDPLLQFTRVARVEGIWTVAVKSDTSSNPQYYDFYIGTCWNGSGSPAPTSLDTVVRLYNPRKSS